MNIWLLSHFHALESQNQIVFYVNINKLAFVPADARVEIFLRWGVLISLGMHCCKSHLQNKKLKPDEKVNAQTIPCKRILAADLVGILKDVHHVMSGTDNKRLSFDEESSFTENISLIWQDLKISILQTLYSEQILNQQNEALEALRKW